MPIFQPALGRRWSCCRATARTRSHRQSVGGSQESISQFHPTSFTRRILTERTVWFANAAGVSKGRDDTVWVVHRGAKPWDAATFFAGGRAEHITDPTPIRGPVVLQLKQVGAVSWWSKGVKPLVTGK